MDDGTGEPTLLSLSNGSSPDVRDAHLEAELMYTVYSSSVQKWVLGHNSQS